MMKSKASLFSLLVLFCCSSAYGFPADTPLNISLSNKSAKIGGLITVVISGKINAATGVSWAACDSLLKNNKQLNLLEVVSGRQGQFFRHQLVFTSTQPGAAILGKLPVVFTSPAGTNTLFTGVIAVEFKPDAMPARLNDIAPINYTPFFKILFVPMWLMVLGVLVFAGAAYSYWRKKQKTKPLPIGQLRINSLKKLDAIGHQFTAAGPASNAAEKISIVFNGYLQAVRELIELNSNPSEASQLNTHGPQAGELGHILELSGQMRFAGKQIPQALLVTHLEEVRYFINNYPSPSP